MATPAQLPPTLFLQPPLTILMIATVLSSLLIPVLIAILFFSTLKARRRPLFWLNVVAICAGLVLAVSTGYQTIHYILTPNEVASESQPTLTAICVVLIPLFVESILMLRLLAIFPRCSTSRVLFFSIFAFPVASKVTRFGLIVCFCKEWMSLTNSGVNAFLALEFIWDLQPYVKAEWFLELLDNSFVSILFIWQLRKAKSKQVGVVQKPHGVVARLRVVFYIALTTYIFPACLNIVQLILAFQPTMTLQCVYALFCNVYVSILGVVFSTLWVTALNKKEEAPVSPPITLPFASQRRSASTSDDTTYSEVVIKIERECESSERG